MELVRTNACIFSSFSQVKNTRWVWAGGTFLEKLANHRHIAEHFPGTVTDFSAFSLPPRIAFTFDLLLKSVSVSLCWFHIPPRV